MRASRWGSRWPRWRAAPQGLLRTMPGRQRLHQGIERRAQCAEQAQGITVRLPPGCAGFFQPGHRILQGGGAHRAGQAAQVWASRAACSWWP